MFILHKPADWKYPKVPVLEDTALTRSARKDLIDTLQNSPQCASMFCDYAKENITGGKGCDGNFLWGQRIFMPPKSLKTVLIFLLNLTSIGLEAFVEGMRKTSVLSRHQQQLEEGYRCCCRTKQYQDRPECRGENAGFSRRESSWTPNVHLQGVCC